MTVKGKGKKGPFLTQLPDALIPCIQPFSPDSRSLGAGGVLGNSPDVMNLPQK